MIEENEKVIEEKFKNQQILFNLLIEKVKLIKESYKSCFLLSEKQLKYFLNDKKLTKIFGHENFEI